MAIALIAAVAAAGCGQDDQPELGAGVVAPTTIATTTTTVPSTTTTTIDFDRPIFQGTTPLAEGAGPAEVAALVAEMRGQTANVSAQVQRLGPFLDLAVAPVAQIIGVDVVLAPEDEEGRHRATATVRFRVPDGGPEMVRAIGDEFVSLAWNPNGQTTDEVDGRTVTDSVFRKPGFTPDEAEFRSSVRAGGGPTTVELTYLVAAEAEEVTDDDGVTYFERLSSWQDSLDLPSAARLTEVGVETGDDDSAAVFARYLLTADDQAEAVAALARAAASGDYELLGADPDDPPTSGPLRLADEGGTLVVVDVSPAPEEETFVVEARHGFSLAPLD